ncbi:MAG: geranylgeranylglycerol-phosphate geranylgeranyltransferase, partial [Candidatus Cloacimonadota bacterium]|nr:geranylgeranylglycerol-phosphate geranylgeranyltransferase [Candidatus Cloacimonadota bacterium]
MPFIKIIRPLNCLFVAACVAFAAYLNNLEFAFSPVLFAMLSAAIIAAGGYVINDFFDIKIDVVNKPHRILPSGKMKPEIAYLYAVLLFIIGMLFSLLTRQILCVVIAFINSFVLFFYAKKFKKSLLVGNFLVSYSAASAFLYGGICSENLSNAIVVAIYAFLYTFLREIAKDGEDIEGDRQYGASTIAIKIGRKKTAGILLIPIILLILSTFLFFINNQINSTSFLLLHLLVNFPLIIFFLLLQKKPEKKNFAFMAKF